MKIIVQRVSQAAVFVNKKRINAIKKGLLLLVGFEKEDTLFDVSWCAQKVLKCRIFEDEHHKLNHSIRDVGGEILSISQFTLAGNMHKGNRPSFENSMPAHQAKAYYETFNDLLAQHIITKTGCFQTYMEIESVNQGPTTLIIESKGRCK